MAKKRKAKRGKLKKIARAHMIFSISLFILYLVLSLIYSPEFLLSDMRGKFRALADDTITVTARVMAPPAKPILSGEAICNDSHLSIDLDWANDEGTQTFSIERDSLPLVSGLTQSSYTDTTVAEGRTYSYVATAYGDMGPGIAVSDSIEISTPSDCGVILPTPEIKVTDFDNNGLKTGKSGYPETYSKRPAFSGTTNMPNAEITTLISLGTVVISAEITANSTGYWTWKPPINISSGRHALLLTAVDPNDPSRTATESFTFLIKSKHDEDDEETSKKEETVPTITPETPIGSPLGFLLSIKNISVLQGQDLETTVEINKLVSNYEGRPARIHYVILDAEGNEIGSVDQDIILRLGAKIDNSMPIAKYAAIGPYRLRAEIIFGKYNLSQEKNFEILPVPILKYGGGIVTTCPELLSRMGTISIWLLICLIIWLTLFWREYLKQLRALRHITEKNLVRMGLIGIKKGKGVPR